MVRKAITWAVVIVVIVFVARNPAGAAQFVRHLATDLGGLLGGK